MTLTLAHIAAMIGAEIAGDPHKTVRAVAAFEDADDTCIALAATPQYIKRLDETGAGALVVPPDVRQGGVNLLRVVNPELAFIKIIRTMHPARKPPAGISPYAVIGEKLHHGEGISIGPTVVIGEHVSLGRNVVLHAGAVIGDSVQIGDDVEIFPNVTIASGCRIGSRVVIHAGTVIGSEGFGHARQGPHYHTIPHIGIVQIDDDVEIGANNTIDRARFGVTRIGRGVKTDNLVHIAHNVVVGEDAVLVAQVGISGSVTVGRRAILAGQAGISGHLKIGDGAVVGPRAGVAKSVDDEAVVSGAPSMPHKQFLRVQRAVAKLPETMKRLSELEKRLVELQKSYDQAK